MKSAVEVVLAEEDHEEHGKRYLIRWSGTDASGQAWKCSWEKQADMDCDERIADFMMASSAERAKRWEAARALGIEDALAESEEDDSSDEEASEVVAAVECHTCAECCRECARSVASVKHSADVTAIQFDISSDWKGSLIARICEAVGIKPEQVVLVWSSPPCESYSQLQYTNYSRGNHCREVHDPQRPPRSLKSCEKQADYDKRQLAYTHDDMISRVNASHVRDHQRGLKYALAVEHPANSMLQHRPFMQQTDWTELTDRTVVDYCNYCSSHYHKPAGMYTSQFGWKPAGKSGTGRCCQDCNAGRWTWDDTRKSGVRYVHDFQLGGPAEKAPPSEKIVDRWHVPEELFEEVMEAAVKHSAECGSSEERKQYVIELFAGQAGNAEQVLKGGMGYIPVDISTKYFSPEWRTINLN